MAFPATIEGLMLGVARSSTEKTPQLGDVVGQPMQEGSKDGQNIEGNRGRP